MTITVLRYRVKSLTGVLNAQSRAVNLVWNFCNDTQKHAIKWGKKWPTGYDLQKLTAGTSRELGLLANTINKVCERYEQSRRQHRKAYLRYRGRRSLGWIPLRGCDLRETASGVHAQGREFRVFKSRPLPTGAKIKDGCSFSQDARGNWYINLVVELPACPARPIERALGIDLGLKEFAALSTGEKIAAPRHFRQLEEALGKAQRARKRRQAARIHARIANGRADFQHKLATDLVRRFDYIAVGNVNAAKNILARGLASLAEGDANAA